MTLRSLISSALLLPATLLLAQGTVVQQGKPFTKTLKGSTGDLFTVVDGIFVADGRHVLFVEEGLTPKVVRLDAQLQPSEELVLKDHLISGVKWTAVAPLISEGVLRCLLVSSTKKGSEFGIGTVSTAGALKLEHFSTIASFELPYVNDPTHTMADRPLPDPILFTRGLAYAQRERIIRSPDGQHYLVNHFSHKGKGNKRFGYAYLDKDLTVLWQGTVELPYEDAKSSIHQILLGNDGRIRLLTYVFQCSSAEQLGDKNCHELHLTTLTEQGKSVHDVLLEKDFVSSARLLEREGGKVTIALRYGSLTGLPGLVASFDPLDPKLKPTPLLDQRLPSIRKTKLMAFGDPAADPKKPVSRTAKIPDEVVDLFALPDGSTLVVETFLDNAYQLPVGDAIAMRHLSGAVRLSQVRTNDSLGWQHIVDRTLMTTAGQAYEGSVALRGPGGTLLLHGHTPRGLDAILRAGADAGSDKSLAPAEPQVLRAAMVDDNGAVGKEGTLLLMEEGFVPCPMGTLLQPGGTRALVKSYDRGTLYRFTLVDLAKLGD
jgi:hypothetical protein